MASTPQKKMHAVAPRETLDRVAFILAFLFGVFGSVLLKVLGAHPFVAAGYSAVILCLYAFAAWAGGRIRIEPETIGDNSYYLGFLFTLTSLAFTLYQLAEPSAAGDRPINIPEVISGFGVALSSTIVGVFLRVIFMQLRPDFVAKDREVRVDINRQYAELRKNMSGILAQMKAFSAESIQQASERDKRIRDSTERFVEDHQNALVKSADALAERFDMVFSKMAQKAVQEISTSVQKSNSQLASSNEDLVIKILALKNRLLEEEKLSIEGIQNHQQRLENQLKDTELRMKGQNAAIEDYVKSVRKLAAALSKKIAPALDDLQERLDKLPESEGRNFWGRRIFHRSLRKKKTEN